MFNHISKQLVVHQKDFAIRVSVIVVSSQSRFGNAIKHSLLYFSDNVIPSHYFELYCSVLN